MIRHKPAGRGHAYRASLDQRVPTHPLAGEPVRLGALATPGLTSVQVEVRDLIQGMVTATLEDLDDPFSRRPHDHA